jgi:hypothetical protein
MQSAILLSSHLIAACKRWISACREEKEQIRLSRIRIQLLNTNPGLIQFVSESPAGFGDDDGATELMKQIILASRDNNTLCSWEVVSEDSSGY